MENNKQKRRTRVGVYAITSICAVAAAGGVGYAIAAAASNPDQEAKKAHTITIEETQTQGFTISCDQETAKMGDTVHFTVVNNSNTKIVPRAIIITSVPKEGSSEEPATSSYELVEDPNSPGTYVATVQILYKRDMKVTLDFDYIKPYVVTFDTNGGATATFTKEVEVDTPVNKPSDPQRNGFTFKYWYLEGSENEEYDWNKKVQANITLKAKWQIIHGEIKWMNHDSSVVLQHDQNVDYGTLPKYVSDTPTKPETTQYKYVFSGWNEEIKPINPQSEGQIFTFTPKFDAVTQEYVVTFDSKGGTTVPQQKALYDTAIQKPTPEYEGHTFLGWFYTDGGTEKEWDFTNDKVKGNITLTAKWQTNKYTVTYDANGGTDVEAVQVEYNNPIQTEPTTTRSHYQFGGWYNATTQWVFGDQGTKVTSNVTLVARWTEDAKFTVSFNTQGGTSIDSQSIYENDHPTAPATTTKTGYTFKGWFDAATGGTEITDWTTQTITGNKTYYAQWTPEVQTVTFTFKDGSTQVKNVNYGEAVADIPTLPTIAGFQAFGWSHNDTTYEPFDQSTLITQSIIVYAHYEAITVTGIQITSYPSKLVYPVNTQAANIDLTGLNVKLIKSYGDPETISSFPTDEWSRSISESLTTEGKKTVTLKHLASEKTVSFDITYTNEFTKLNVTQDPTTTVYVKNGTFNPKGLKVQLTDYLGQTKTEVEWTTSDIDEHKSEGYEITASTSTLGVVPVTITFKATSSSLEDLTATTGITVFNEYESLNLTTNPTKTTYSKGDTFDPKGMVLTLKVPSGATGTWVDKPITYTTSTLTEHSEITFNGTTLNNLGVNYVTATYTSSTSPTYTLTVKIPVSVSEAYYTVKFYLNDSSTSTTVHATETVKKGDKVTQPVDPTLTGKIFLGWYTDRTGTTAYDFSTATTASPGDAYAKWVSTSNFNHVEWSDMISAVTTFEAISSPTVADATTLCTALGITSPTTGSDAKTTLQNNLVGLTGTIEINGHLHTVRCIDAMHDTISGSATKAALTFELTTLLSDSDGNMLETIWNLEEDKNYDYTTSQFRKNLTGVGTKSISWYNNAGEVSAETRSALAMLPTDISNAIKTVSKEVGVSTDSGSTYNVTSYTDKIFPLTYKEMAQTDYTSVKEEGTAYKYWTDHNTNADRIKKDANNSIFYYKLSTPFLNGYSDEVMIVNAGGGINNAYLGSASGVSFGFCI